jgi:hypothetical protein
MSTLTGSSIREKHVNEQKVEFFSKGASDTSFQNIIAKRLKEKEGKIAV